MPRAGAVWVDVLPNMSRFGQQLDREIGEPVARASSAAGESGGEGLMSGMKGAVLAGAAAVGVAAGALLVAGIDQAVAKQKATGKLKAQLDLSAADAKKAGEAAGKLYGSTVTESVDEAAAAVRATMAAGLAPPKATTKQLAQISTKVQDLQTLFEVDLGQAANAAGQAVKTGLAKNANEALDIMYRGFQIMGPRADDLADTFNEYSTIFRSLGLDMKTVTGLFSQGMKAGARDTDTVADALKEFQIRTTDGSTASAEGFKLLGMNAKDATAQFAAGGAGAAKGLQTVLDKLRAMKNPVDRNAASVALFGTKSEDLGQALYALDPSKAVTDLGKVGGAATRAGDALRSDAGSKFEAFKRRGLMALGDVTAKYVLPRLEDFIDFVDDRIVPGVKAISGGFQAGVGWVKEYGLWFTPLAVAIGGVTLAMTASSIATGITMGVIGAYSIAIRTAAAVTRAWTLVQIGFNAVMALNPVTLIIIGIVALGAAIVVAYKKSETFRNIVNGVWSAIQTGWAALWAFLKPGIDALMVGLRAIGTAASWLWTTVLSPVFSGIGMAARILATIITVALVLPTVLAFKALGAIGSWLWDAALGPAFRGIGAGAMWLYNNGIKPAGAAGVAVFKALGAAGTWVWKNALQPAFQGIGSGAMWLYRNGIKPPIDAGMATLRALGAAGKWVWTNALQPAFRSIGAGASWLYNQAIKPPIDKARSLARSLGLAFEAGAKVVGDAMNSIKDKAKKPVSYVIDVVYNRGIRGVWNAVAGAFGAPKLDPFKGFARGGVLAGQSSYRDGDDQLVPLRRGEGIAVSEAMRDPYERKRLLAVNAAAMHGRSLRPFQGEGFARGGIFDWVKGAASKGVDLAKSGVGWLKDGMKASAVAGLNSVVKPLLNKISGSASLYRDMIRGVPERMVKEIVGYSGKADNKLEASGIGGKGFKSGLSWARTQNGKPYQWGGNGDPSWDCSGFLSAIESVIRGQRPHRRWATGAFSGATAPSGWVLNARSPFQIGITNSGVGHTAGTINGTNVESRGGDGVIVGGSARSYKSSLFTHRYGLKVRGYADGGRPRRGEVAVVGERGPELRVFDGSSRIIDNATSMRIAAQVGAGRVQDMTRPLASQAPATPQGRTVVAAPRGQAPAPAGGDNYYFYPRTLDMTVGDLDALQRRKDALDRAGRPK
ncbi:phage tail tape measure protein [Streptomyces anulatus]|uniref:phage tail tape measure protein n=1 Tax=Streptomyces anulatus TaxID=1892 RepID=UPI00340A93EF